MQETRVRSLGWEDSLKQEMATHTSILAQRILCPWSFLGKNTGVRSCSLLQGIFPTQRSNQRLLHCRQIFLLLSYWGSPRLRSVISSLKNVFSFLLVSFRLLLAGSLDDEFVGLEFCSCCLLLVTGQDCLWIWGFPCLNAHNKYNKYVF